MKSKCFFFSLITFFYEKLRALNEGRQILQKKLTQLYGLQEQIETCTQSNKEVKNKFELVDNRSNAINKQCSQLLEDRVTLFFFVLFLFGK